MAQNRRTVLGLGAGAALAAGAAQAATAAGPPLKGITVTTIVTAAGPGLGVRTPRGVLDVAGVERDRRLGLPTTVNQLIAGRGDLRSLAALLANGAAAAPASRLIAEDKVRYGLIVDDPAKIICVGLNYVAHAAEGGAAPPKEPI